MDNVLPETFISYINSEMTADEFEELRATFEQGFKRPIDYFAIRANEEQFEPIEVLPFQPLPGSFFVVLRGNIRILPVDGYEYVKTKKNRVPIENNSSLCITVINCSRRGFGGTWRKVIYLENSPNLVLVHYQPNEGTPVHPTRCALRLSQVAIFLHRSEHRINQIQVAMGHVNIVPPPVNFQAANEHGALADQIANLQANINGRLGAIEADFL